MKASLETARLLALGLPLILSAPGCLLTRPFGGGQFGWDGEGFAAWCAGEDQFGWHISGAVLAADGRSLLEGELIQEMACSPAAGPLAVVSSRDRVRAGGLYNYPTTEVYLWDPPANDLRRLTSNTTLEMSPAISASGETVAFMRAGSYADTYLAWPWGDWNLVVVDVDEQSEMTWPVGARAEGVAVSPTGRWVAVSADGELRVLDRDTRSFGCARVAGSQPVFSGDGARIAFVQDAHAPAGSRLMVAAFAGGALGPALELARDLRPMAFSDEAVICLERRGGEMRIVSVPCTGGAPTPLACCAAEPSP